MRAREREKKGGIVGRHNFMENMCHLSVGWLDWRICNDLV